MKYSSIYIGTWLPRTLIHLREFYNAAAENKSALFSEKQLKKWIAPLGVTSVRYESGAIDAVVVETKKDVTIAQSEEGIVLAIKKITSPKKDAEELSDYFKNTVLKYWSKLYSRGAPIPRTFQKIEEFYPFVITVSGATEPEVKKLFRQFDDDIVERHSWSVGRYWSGRHLVVFERKKIAREVKVIPFLMFLNAYKFQAQKMLHLHRIIWEDIEAIREKTSVRSKDLPVMRDSLLDLERQISYFSARLKQMGAPLDLLGEFLGERKKVKDYAFYMFEELASLKATQTYLEHLWAMTSDYARGTINLLQLFYSDNERRELNTLQMIFIIGVIAEVIVLGTITGGRMNLTSPSGELLAVGDLFTFSYVDLLVYGLFALFLAAVLYALLHWAFNMWKHNRVLGDSIDVTRFRERVEKRLK
ncbi:MAG: hypothetical protein ABIG66_02165 [Candidatus Kerfeldbacteria bacterium]